MSRDEIDWIVEKASELLYDKIEDGPLDESDVNLAFDLFAEPRLQKISDSFSDEEEFERKVNEVRGRLHQVARELNEEEYDKRVGHD